MGNENIVTRPKDKMEDGYQRSATRISSSTNNFCVYGNDMPQGITSYISLFADEVKIQRRIKSREDSNELKKN